MRRFFATVLIGTIWVCPLFGYSGGDGSAGNPYQIADTNDLLELAADTGNYNKYFILTADIDLDPALPGGQMFTRALIAPDTDSAAGNFQGTPFSGVFDGNGHQISNLTIDAQANDFVGLFGYVNSAGQIRNLTLENSSINGISGSFYMGSFVGFNAGRIENCGWTGAVSGYYVGGLAGRNSSVGIITNCRGQGTVTVCAAATDAGGLVGYNVGSINYCAAEVSVSGLSTTRAGGVAGYSVGQMSNCVSTGSVSGSVVAGGLVGINEKNISNCYATGSVNGANYAGGLVGWNNTLAGSISFCYSTGAVSGTTNVGGLVGDNNNGTVSNSFWDTQTSGQGASDGGTGKTTAEMMTISTFTDMGWDFVGESANGTEDYWEIRFDGTEYPRLSWQSYFGGDGTSENPYEISTARQLMSIGSDPNLLDKYFILTADIDLDPALPGNKVFNTAVIAPDSLEEVYITPFNGTPFTGSFEGNHYTISNLTINAAPSADYIGLFGYIQDGKIQNLELDNYSISCGDNSWYMGAIAGYGNNTVFLHCVVIGEMTANDNNNYFGGIAGIIDVDSRMENCRSSSVIISGSSNSAAGVLVGVNKSSFILASYSTGTVSGEQYCLSFGGFAGNNANGSIINCYNNASVSVEDSSQNAGGFLGYNSNMGIVRNSYSTGVVIGASSNYTIFVGGFIGENPGGAVNCFWDTETSGMNFSDGGKGRTTLEMCQASNYTGWNTPGQSVWVIDEGIHPPRLLWESSGGTPLPAHTLEDFLTGSGENTNPYVIINAGQLNKIGLFPEAWDKWFKLNADIDLSAITGTEFNIIGVSPRIPFNGHFDGDHHIIESFSFITDVHAHYAGLFGCLSNGFVGNLQMQNTAVETAGIYVGGLVGYAVSSSELSNCFVNGTIIGESSTGGLVGRNENSAITHCSVNGIIEAEQYAGGLVGYNAAGSLISGCSSTGQITKGSSLGGLVGKNDFSTITDCTSSGSVIAGYFEGSYGYGGMYEGGLVGENYHGTIQNCSSDCAISAIVDNRYVGGITGISSDESVISGCKWNGTLSGFERVGGLVGQNDRSVISNCVSSGNIITDPDGGWHIGGLVGEIYNSSGNLISNCCRIGDVSGDDSVGGLAGAGDYGIIKNCFSVGNVTGRIAVGGLLGSSCGTITNSYSRGTVSGQEELGGFIGFANNCSVSNCYSRGAIVVTGTGLFRGPFIGQNISSPVLSCYYSPASGYANGYGTFLTESQMKQQVSFVGWDFLGESVNSINEIWRMCEGGVDYPRLSWEFAQNGDFACPDGVGMNDLIVLSETWLTSVAADPATFNYACDADGSETIDMGDIAILSQYWLGD